MLVFKHMSTCRMLLIDFKFVIKYKCLIIVFPNLENAFSTDGATSHEYWDGGENT